MTARLAAGLLVAVAGVAAADPPGGAPAGAPSGPAGGAPTTVPTATIGAGSAAAPAPALVQPPAGWQARAGLAAAAATKTSGVDHFGVAGAQIASQAFVPAGPGLVLYATRVSVAVPGDLALAARVEVDALHATSRRAALSGTGIVEDGWQERVDPDKKQVEAELAWRDPSAKTSETSRIVIAADATTMAAVTGECIAGEDADPAALARCKEALATLDPGVGERVAIALAPAGTEAPPPTPPPDRQAAHMDDGSHAPLPPITIPQDRPPTDRRPVYVGLGVVVLALVFYWNRRRRARLEEEESDDR